MLHDKQLINYIINVLCLHNPYRTYDTDIEGEYRHLSVILLSKCKKGYYSPAKMARSLHKQTPYGVLSIKELTLKFSRLKDLYDNTKTLVRTSHQI